VKKKASVGVILLFLVVAIVFVLNNPPLGSYGHSVSNTNNSATIELHNTGFANVKIKEVLVNGSLKPEEVELGVSRTGNMIVGGNLEEDPYISFHDITSLPIKQELSAERMNELFSTNDRSTIIHYGIRLWHNDPIDNVTIKYSYLGIPMSLEKRFIDYE
jgi:hypothetical protein